MLKTPSVLSFVDNKKPSLLGIVLNTFPRSLLKFKAKVQQLNTFPRTPIKFKVKVQHYNTFLRTPLKLKVKVHPCPRCMFCVLKFAPLH